MGTRLSRLWLACIVTVVGSCFGFAPARSHVSAQHRAFAGEAAAAAASTARGHASAVRANPTAVSAQSIREGRMKSPSGKPTVNLSTTRLAIASGSSDTLTARLSRSLRRAKLTWTSSNPIVTVKPITAKGDQVRLEAKNASGDATVTAAATSGSWTYTASALIRVHPGDAGGFIVDSGVLLGYKGSSPDVRIPGGVTAIDGNAFFLRNVERIHVPASVSSIGDQAFAKAPNLKEIAFEDTDVNPSRLASVGSSVVSEDRKLMSLTLPRSVTKIAPGAFQSCSMREISLPAGLTEIPDDAFRHCAKLAKVTLSDSVTRIGQRAFKSNGELSDFTLIGGGGKKAGVGLPSKLTEIGAKAFSGTAFTEFSLPKGVVSVGDGFLSGSKVKKVTLNEGLKHVGTKAFVLTPVEEIDIPDSVQTIASGTFSYAASLKRVLIGKNVRADILVGAFVSTPKLSEIQVKDDALNYTSVDGVLYNKDKTKLIAFPAAWKRGVSSYSIPEGVREISNKAFHEVKIMNVSFPSTLKRIGNEAFRLTALTSVNLPKGVETVEMWAFSAISSLVSVDLGGTITVGTMAFSHNGKLTYVNMRPELGRLTTIKDYGFGRTSIVDLVIPDSVTSIEEHAFWSNDKLTKVHIGAKLTSLGQNAFYHTRNLKNFTVSAVNSVFFVYGNVLYTKRADGLHLTLSPSGNSSIEYAVRRGTVQIDRGAFSENAKLAKVVLPEGLKRIEGDAFYGASALTEVKFPQSLEYVDGFASTGLREVEFGTNIREIAQDCFSGTMPVRLIVRRGIDGRFTDSTNFRSGEPKSAYFGEGMTSVSYVYGVFPEYLVLPSTLKEFRLDGASGTGTGKVKVYVAAAPGTAAWNLVSVQMSKAGMDPARQLHSYTPLKAVLRHADKLVRGSKSPVTVEVSGGVEGRRQARILAVSPTGKTSVLHDWTDASQLPGTKAPTTAGRTTAAPSEVPTPADSQASTPAGGPTPSADPKGGNGSAYGFTAEITVPADGSALRLEARDETGYTFRTQ